MGATRGVDREASLCPAGPLSRRPAHGEAPGGPLPPATGAHPARCVPSPMCRQSLGTRAPRQTEPCGTPSVLQGILTSPPAVAVACVLCETVRGEHGTVERRESDSPVISPLVQGANTQAAGGHPSAASRARGSRLATAGVRLCSGVRPRVCRPASARAPVCEGGAGVHAYVYSRAGDHSADAGSRCPFRSPLHGDAAQWHDPSLRVDLYTARWQWSVVTGWLVGPMASQGMSLVSWGPLALWGRRTCCRKCFSPCPRPIPARVGSILHARSSELLPSPWVPRLWATGEPQHGLWPPKCTWRHLNLLCGLRAHVSL